MPMCGFAGVRVRRRRVLRVAPGAPLRAAVDASGGAGRDLLVTLGWVSQLSGVVRGYCAV